MIDKNSTITLWSKSFAMSIDQLSKEWTIMETQLATEERREAWYEWLKHRKETNDRPDTND